MHMLSHTIHITELTFVSLSQTSAWIAKQLDLPSNINTIVIYKHSIYMHTYAYIVYITDTCVYCAYMDKFLDKVLKRHFVRSVSGHLYLVPLWKGVLFSVFLLFSVLLLLCLLLIRPKFSRNYQEIPPVLPSELSLKCIFIISIECPPSLDYCSRLQVCHVTHFPPLLPVPCALEVFPVVVGSVPMRNLTDFPLPSFSLCFIAIFSLTSDTFSETTSTVFLCF